MNKGIIYYTDNRLKEPIFSIVQKHILEAGLPVVSSSSKPIDFGNNEVIGRKPNYVTMIKQITSCLERSVVDYVFFCEHDVLYSKSHFDFTPPKNNIFYYNKNAWRWLYKTDKLIRHDRMLSLSSLCVNRKFALDHYSRRMEAIESRIEEFSSRDPNRARKWGYEPGTKKKRRGGFSDDDFDTWESEIPLIDIRHKNTFTPSKTTLKEFRHKPKWWKEISIDEIEGWNLKELFNL